MIYVHCKGMFFFITSQAFQVHSPGTCLVFEGFRGLSLLSHQTGNRDDAGITVITG
jgi:hypothetical protein